MYYYTRQQTKIILAKKILCKEKDAKKKMQRKILVINFPIIPRKKMSILTISEFEIF